ncbi:MAG: hypothetical protein KDE27_05500, partial [Planctomycetes bacterium]|nr:hypothetical protein [Planctomycetota bacterium]
LELEREFFARSAVPLLQRAVDLPVQITAPWLGGDSAGTVALADGDGATIAVGEAIVRAFDGGVTEIDGAVFGAYEVRARLTPRAVGAIALGGSLRFAYASAFEETLLGGRQPVDRHELAVEAEPAMLQAIAPPSDAPVGWSGAIGEFEVAAAVNVEQVEVGDTFELVLGVRGAGNLADFDAPPWPELPGFVVQGMLERRDADAREFVFDVLALRLGAALPPLPFVVFAPAASAFRTIHTPPVVLRVVARDPTRPLPPRVQRLIAQFEPEPASGPWLWLGLGAGVAVFVIAVVGLRRGRRRRA